MLVAVHAGELGALSLLDEVVRRACRGPPSLVAAKQSTVLRTYSTYLGISMHYWLTYSLHIDPSGCQVVPGYSAH